MTTSLQKKKTLVLALVTACCAAFFIAGLPLHALSGASQNLPGRPKTFSDLAESVSSAVVNIRTESTVEGGVYQHFFNSPFGREQPFNEFFEKFFKQPFPHERKQRSLGSGFIIDKDGYIVTNHHVVKEADEIKIKLENGDSFSAELVGSDPQTDLALLKIEADKALPHLKLGNSDNLHVGDWVLAIGSPFGLEQTVTAGIVSAKGRVIGAGPYDNFIQTDASINPGNSGGPLLNMKGEVIGINTAIVAAGQGIGFAIPANMANNIVSQLKTEGEVTRGWLGVRIQPVTEEIAEYYDLPKEKGALVTEIFPGDPADEAGIQVQDVILKINGKSVEDSRELSATIANIPVGEEIAITLWRNGHKEEITVKVAKRDEQKIAQKEGEPGKAKTDIGISVANITNEVARRLNLNSTRGVYVTDVEQDSKAARIGLRPGDVIKEINRQKINNIEDYRNIIKDIEAGDVIRMAVRKPNGMYVFFKITK